ncbi:receptor-like serine/threonine-protein kinase SD1-8 [Tanacetum coccineum]
MDPIRPNRKIVLDKTYAPPHKVLTNDDLLTEILIRLPILCIHLFTTVSKQWLRILTSPDFTRKRSQIRNLDPPAGIFVNHITSSFHCVFVSLDPRIKSRKYTCDKSFTLGFTEAVVNVNILQSCNGLLLCTGWGSRFDYIYNQYTNLVKMLSEPDYAHGDSIFYGCAGLRLAFELTKSSDYKVVRAGSNSCEIVIQIYSSETSNWSLCRVLKAHVPHYGKHGQLLIN